MNTKGNLGQDVKVNLGQVEFSVRAAAVFVHEGHVLLHSCDVDHLWALPGGRIHTMESTADALRREMREEIGDEVIVGPLQWTVEVFFSQGDRDYHEVGLYYLTHFVNPERYDKAKSFRGAEGAYGLTFRWIPISQIDQFPDIVPPFLYQALKEFPGGARHIVDKRPSTRQA